MYSNYTPVQIVCEGDSECSYIQQLNRILQRGPYGSAAFTPYSAGTGYFKNVKREFNRIIRTQRNCKVIAWVDRDIYIRNDKKCNDNRIKDKVITFYFSTMNFEDFLMLHQNYELAKKWFDLVNSKDHWKDPLCEQQYLRLFKKFFHNYKKGELPFEIQKEQLTNLFFNTKENFFKKLQYQDNFSKYLESEIYNKNITFK